MATQGGSLGFETGHVVVGTSALDLDVLYGVGEDDHNLVDGSFYQGQIPLGWYAIGRSTDGLFQLDDQNGVWHVKLNEKFWGRESCPELPPPLASQVANDFNAFLQMLRLPSWANKP